MNTMAKLLFGTMVALFLAGAVAAQICPGSHVTYLVRDKEGKPIDASGPNVSFAGGASGASERWKVSGKGWAR